MLYTNTIRPSFEQPNPTYQPSTPTSIVHVYLSYPIHLDAGHLGVQVLNNHLFPFERCFMLARHFVLTGAKVLQVAPQTVRFIGPLLDLSMALHVQDSERYMCSEKAGLFGSNQVTVLVH
jgi:hypothetical protein